MRIQINSLYHVDFARLLECLLIDSSIVDVQNLDIELKSVDVGYDIAFNITNKILIKTTCNCIFITYFGHTVTIPQDSFEDIVVQ